MGTITVSAKSEEKLPFLTSDWQASSTRRRVIGINANSDFNDGSNKTKKFQGTNNQSPRDSLRKSTQEEEQGKLIITKVIDTSTHTIKEVPEDERNSQNSSEHSGLKIGTNHPM